ncbi:MAG TPA: hypothetical protein VMQ76_02895, partial [Terracidiphilus sp.]|nr:hypothetical protein [Terracidiphilus sp.]
LVRYQAGGLFINLEEFPRALRYCAPLIAAPFSIDAWGHLPKSKRLGPHRKWRRGLQIISLPARTMDE